MGLQATNIDEVIKIMDHIIQESMTNQSRLGYFAALYRTVTLVIRDECDNGFFENNDLIRHMDAVFANRYFAAYDLFHAQSGIPTQAWQASFDYLDNEQLLILQHLLLGMNAHIKLDLGIATAEVAEGELTESLTRDFYRLNNILAWLIDTIQSEIAEASPLIHYIDKWAWRADETFVRVGINWARDDALEFAKLLIATPQDQWEEAIQKRDKQVADFSRRVIASTRFPLTVLIWLINLRESKDARFVTSTMSNEAWQERVKDQIEALIEKAEAQGVDLSQPTVSYSPLKLKP